MLERLLFDFVPVFFPDLSYSEHQFDDLNLYPWGNSRLFLKKDFPEKCVFLYFGKTQQVAV